MAERTHPVMTGGVRFDFEADLRFASSLLSHALVTADKPIMHKFLAVFGYADTLADLREAIKRIASVLADLESLPPKVEIPGEDC